MIFLNPAPGQELENAHYFEEKGFGKIADTPNEAINIVSDLTNHEHKLENMTNQMRESKVSYSTPKIM